MKGDKSLIDDIGIRLNGFAAIEHIDHLKNYFLPKIALFSEQIDKFMFDNKNMRECIVRFDEDIAMKSNKSDILILKQELEGIYISAQEY
tara:strand:+ start:1048 stop:1317 length:270 start_codon:yes stop_codon:yes gene_type:complete